MMLKILVWHVKDLYLNRIHLNLYCLRTCPGVKLIVFYPGEHSPAHFYYHFNSQTGT